MRTDCVSDRVHETGAVRRRSPAGLVRRAVRAAGYTLVELLIVIAVLGLAGAMLVPSLIDTDWYTVQAAVRNVVCDLTFAQSDALAHQELRRVYFYPDGSGYCITRVSIASFDNEFDEDTADYVDDPLATNGNAARYVVKFNTDDRFKGVTIKNVAIDGDNTWVTFDELGGTVRSGSLPGVGGELYVLSEHGAYRVSLAGFTGKISVTKLSDEDAAALLDGGG